MESYHMHPLLKDHTYHKELQNIYGKMINKAGHSHMPWALKGEPSHLLRNVTGRSNNGWKSMQEQDM